MIAPVAIWTLRIILALAFLFFGLIKFPAGEGSPGVSTGDQDGG